MSQPPLDPIAGDGISDSAADDKADAWPVIKLPVIKLPVIKLHSMDHQRRTTHAESTPGRSPKILRAAHSQ
jgi:hypothetical protein